MALGVAAYAGVYWAMLRTSISPLGPEINAALGIGFSALEGISTRRWKPWSPGSPRC